MWDIEMVVMEGKFCFFLFKQIYMYVDNLVVGSKSIRTCIMELAAEDEY